MTRADLKRQIGEILQNALGGGWPRYESAYGYTKWGLVQEDINAAIDKMDAPLEVERDYAAKE